MEWFGSIRAKNEAKTFLLLARSLSNPSSSVPPYTCTVYLH